MSKFLEKVAKLFGREVTPKTVSEVKTVPKVKKPKSGKKIPIKGPVTIPSVEAVVVEKVVPPPVVEESPIVLEEVKVNKKTTFKTNKGKKKSDKTKKPSKVIPEPVLTVGTVKSIEEDGTMVIETPSNQVVTGKKPKKEKKNKKETKAE